MPKPLPSMLKRDFEATRVIAFDSLAKQRFTPESDIDMALFLQGCRRLTLG